MDGGHKSKVLGPYREGNKKRINVLKKYMQQRTKSERLEPKTEDIWKLQSLFLCKISD